MKPRNSDIGSSTERRGRHRGRARGLAAWRQCVLAIATVFATTAPAVAQCLSPEARERAERIADRADAWLRAQQEPGGGWRLEGEGPRFPAITALALNALTQHTPEANMGDPAIARAVAALLGAQQPDGGIYSLILPNYNTACAVSALSRIPTPQARQAIERGQRFLVSLQWGSPDHVEGPAAREKGDAAEDHPFYGGVGYGQSGRPDLSNLHLMLQALEDSGYEASGPTVQRAVVFLQRVQMLDGVNDLAYAQGSRQGGFIYATGPKGDQAGEGESKAGMLEETLSDGTTESRLRAYGSMTYAGFKSYVYAGLARDDPRVVAAYDWLRRNYTLDENPGVGLDGYYYYLLVLARALDAWGEPMITIEHEDGTVEHRRWAEDLVAALEARQLDDGSIRSVDDRWMENDQVLITAYCLIALRTAMGE